LPSTPLWGCGGADRADFVTPWASVGLMYQCVPPGQVCVRI
jgi:hypothetical protein